jgi:uncharacterized protein YlxW (UPF0749 family)
MSPSSDDSRKGLTIPIVKGFRRAKAGPRRAEPDEVELGTRRSIVGRVTTALVCVVAGLLVVLSAANARGIDLRPARNPDLISLVQAQSRRNAELSSRAAAERAEVEQLSGDAVESSSLDAAEGRQRQLAGLTPVIGPAVTVTLDDAPDSISAEGVDGDLLVVHQQDIQAVVNAFWSGGAEAMTIQGQRVIATTGIKCVGNTVVLHGVPYAPPYVISAIGDPERLRTALTRSPALQIYRQYVEAYALGYREEAQAVAQFPAYLGSTELRHARAAQGR